MPAPVTLVIHAGGVGDFLLTCPALARLAEAGPVDLAGRVERLSLAVAAGLARSAYDLEAIDFASLFEEPSRSLKNFLAPYDRVVAWMRDDDGRIRRGLARVGVRDACAFPGVPPQDWTRHASDYYLECMGLPNDESPFHLSIAPEPPPRDVVIHPGSGGQGKNWPFERFASLAEDLQARGRRVEWCVGPAENKSLLPREAATLPHGKLVDLAARLASASLYVGNDSGVTHLAASLGCPTVAIFGPTNPRVWAPRGDHVRVVRGDPWPNLEAVLRALP